MVFLQQMELQGGLGGSVATSLGILRYAGGAGSNTGGGGGAAGPSGAGGTAVGLSGGTANNGLVAGGIGNNTNSVVDGSTSVIWTATTGGLTAGSGSGAAVDGSGNCGFPGIAGGAGSAATTQATQGARGVIVISYNMAVVAPTNKSNSFFMF